MKPAILAAVVAVLIALQTATLHYVVEVEHRLTAVETFAKFGGFSRQGMPLKESETVRLGTRSQRVDDRQQ